MMRNTIINNRIDKSIIIFLCLTKAIEISLATLFKLTELRNTKNLSACKYFTINAVSKVDCGGLCNYDEKCMYFKYTEQSPGCIVCSAGDTVSLIENGFTYVSRSVLKEGGYVFARQNMCNESNCLPKDCSEYRNQGYHISGVYDISTVHGQLFQVYCDMETDGGGWTVFQRRIDGSENFYRTWSEYETGFGNLSREFWLGNANLASIAVQGTYQLRIDVGDFEYTNVYGLHEDFTINANNYYSLNYTTYTGNVGGDDLRQNKGCRFTAKNRDLDRRSGNCALLYKGAWWYNACHAMNLNGLYLKGPHTAGSIGVNVYSFRGHHYSLRFTEMKIRPTIFTKPYYLNDLETDFPPFKDCAELRDRGVNISGIYPVSTRGKTQSTFNVYCDMRTSGGGWLVFQRRMDGSENFYRTYNEYKNGFGNISSEFWLGNDNIAAVTEQGSYELRIDLEDFENNHTYAQYAAFSINRNDKYKAWVTGYSGDAGDSMSPLSHNMKFTTYDADNDVGPNNCAVKFKGAGWLKNCHASNLNGLYLGGSFTNYATGVTWAKFRGQYYSLKFTEMKIRPAGYQPPN